MELSIYFPQNQPRTEILQVPKAGFWRVKKPMAIGNIIGVPLHRIGQKPTKNKCLMSYRVGRHKPTNDGFYLVEALPLFVPNKNMTSAR